MGDDVMANRRSNLSPGTDSGPDGSPAATPEQRRLPFGRDTPFGDPSLSGLFALLRETQDRDSRIELSRFAREKLRAAFPAGSGNSGEVLLANGLRVQVDLGDSFGAEFMAGHLNEFDLLDAVTANIPDGAKIIDVGANFGLYALHSVWASGPASRAVAFEPLPSAASLLKRNLEVNHLSAQICFVESAVGVENGKADFFIAEDGAFSGLHDTKRSRLAAKIEVPVISLDASPDIASLGPVDFLKVDVEGHEGAVLAGARKLLESSPGLLAVLEFSHKNVTETGRFQLIAELQRLSEAGFRFWLHDDRGVHLEDSIAESLTGLVSATVILGAKQCDWAEDVIASLDAAVNKRASSDVSHGLQCLLMAVRDARQMSLQAETLSGRFGSGVPAIQALQEIDHLLGEQQAKIKSLSARIEGLEQHAATLQSKLNDRLNALHELSAQRNANETALKSMIEKGSLELTDTRERAQKLILQLEDFRKAAHAQQEELTARTKALEMAQESSDQFRAQLSDAHSKIEVLQAELSEANSRNALLEESTASQLEELEKRRTVIRQLQQREALLRLGKHIF